MAALTDRIWKRVARAVPKTENWLTVPVRVNGRQFDAPVLNKTYCQVTEPWMVQLLGRLLPKRKGTFVDVGMNLGQTLLIAKALEHDRPYIGFEPNPHCFTYCERLVQQNQIKHATLVPVGLGKETGLARLQLYSDSPVDQSASLVENFRPGQQIVGEELVPVFRFEDVLQVVDLENIGIVKIDVEGGELGVLESMSTALRKWQPWIVVEILPSYSEDNVDRVDRQKTIEQLMDELDYLLLRIYKSSENQFSGLKEITSIGIYDEIALSDYVFIPKGNMNIIEDDIMKI